MQSKAWLFRNIHQDFDFYREILLITESLVYTNVKDALGKFISLMIAIKLRWGIFLMI